jgi:hypothetical protein
MAADEKLAQSLRFNRDDARAVFRDVQPRQLVLALLATIKPEREWNGCRVFLGSSCGDDGETACVQVTGSAAAEVREGLAAAFRSAGIPVRDASACASAAEAVTEALDGRWV